MLKLIKRELNISIITSLVYIMLGIVILLFPEMTINIICTTIAVISILYGIIITISNLIDIEKSNTLTLGMIALVIGIALLIYPNSATILFSLGLGIWLMSGSLARIKMISALKEVAKRSWKVVFISSIITLLIGLSFIFAPLSSATILVKICAVLMIIYSLIDIFEIIYIRKQIKNFTK